MIRRVFSILAAASIAAVTNGCSGGTNSLPNIPASVALSASSSHHSTVTSNVAGKVKPSALVIGLNDSFSQDAVGSPAANWNVVSGTWLVCPAGAAHAYCQTSQNAAETLSGATWWSDYTINALITDSNIASGGVGIIGRVHSVNQFYEFELRPQLNGSTPYWYLLKKSATGSTTLASGAVQAPDTNPNYSLQLAFSGNQITASIAFDGGNAYRTLTTVTDSSYATGQAGLFTWGSRVGSYSNVLVTLADNALPSESAVSSSSFVDTIGMNGHFESPIYYNNFPQVRSLIATLGIRHYRVSAGQILFPGAYLSQLTDLHNSFGTKFNVLTDLHTTPTQVIVAVEKLPVGSVVSVEGPNESDNPGQGAGYDPTFAVDVPVYMQALYTAIKSTPATSQVSVIGPSFQNYQSYAAIGNISSWVDNGNMHDYFGGFNPGSPGWGGGGYSFAPGQNYGSIAWNIGASGQATGSKPVIATETGYYTAATHGATPLDVQAKYVPRLYFEQYLHQVPRTFMYQLVGYNNTTADGTLDIVSSSFVPSPAYNALSGMISVLNDNNSQSGSATYNWGLAGQTTNVHHVLLHRADGTMILPLWIETPSFDPNANGGLGAEITVPMQTVTVSVAQPYGNAVLWTCNSATGGWVSTPVSIIDGSVTLNLSDSVSILVVAHA